MKNQILLLVVCVFGLSQCEQIGLNINSRILGGIPAPSNSFNYQAGIFFNNKFVCNGELINEQHIISVASCVNNLNLNSVTVRVGNNDLTLAPGFAVDKIITHKKYKVHNITNGQYVVNDVAILKLNQTVYKTRISRSNSLPKANTKCTISGWGNPNLVNIKQLKYAYVQIVDFEKCKKEYKLSNIKIDDSMICATTNSSDTCTFDFGAPLVCEGKLQGMASFGSIICGSGFPKIYTSIPHFNKWITKTAGASSIILNSVLFITVSLLLRLY